MLEKITGLRKTYRHINRYREIISIIVKYGFGDFISRLQIKKHLDLGKQPLPRLIDENIIELSTWQRVRLVLEELGPSFIKLGQVLSTRPDLLPPTLIIELEKLQHEVKPFPSEKAREIVQEELGKPIADVFLEFEDKPVASASIAQTHKARLLSGEKVALKVQRPNIRKIIKTDIEIMFHLADLIEKYIEDVKIVDPKGIAMEFSKTISKELDFTIEASNIKRFSINFHDDDRLYVPELYPDLCSDNLIVMEYIDAIPLTKKRNLTEMGIDPVKIAKIGTDVSLKQIFEFGFFHADPHPGNVFVKSDKEIVLLDFGMVGYLSQKYQENISDLMLGLIMKDVKMVTRTTIKMSDKEFIDNYEKFEVEIGLLILQYAYIRSKDVELGRLLEELMNILKRYDMRLPSNYYLLIKSLITIEGVALDLDPNFDIIEYISPYAKRIVKTRFNPKKIGKELYFSSLDLFELLLDLPRETRDIIKLIKEGKTRIEFEHRNLEPMLEKHDQITNRIAFAIVLGSLIIGSSLVILSGIPPKWNEMPVIGLLGYIVAGIIGFWLLISIMKHGKM